MRTIVLYETKHGSTETYAKDIAKAVGADVMPLKNFKFKDIKNYDTIVFGGWVRGNIIRGVDAFLTNWEKMKEKNVIIFSVGLSLPNKEMRDALISSNLLDLYHLRFYQLQGNFDFQKLGPLEKMLIKTSIGRMENDENFDDAHKSQFSMLLNTPLNIYDHEGVEKVIRVLNKISAETPQA